MCNPLPLTVPPSRSERQRRLCIWEINPAWHCSLIGTCLTLNDLRSLARKYGFKGIHGQHTDYYLHGHFVREVEKKSRISKSINKLLDRKHASAIKRFKQASSTDELVTAWNDAYQIGDIPGPYWAILSHPMLNQESGSHIYGEVHMLSHLVGASNRADISELRRLEQRSVVVGDKHELEIQRHRRRIAEKTLQINEQQGEIALLKGKLASEKKHSPLLEETPAGENTGIHTDDQELVRTRHRLSQITAETVDLRSCNDRLSNTVCRMESEVKFLELALMDKDENTRTDTCPFDFGGRCILYVGGHRPHVCRLRGLVVEWNGELLHHDGGLERSIGELAAAITKADAVVFPTDCISHSAASKVKQLCRQQMKTYVPLRTSGIASFVAGVRDSIDGIIVPGEPNGDLTEILRDTR